MKISARKYAQALALMLDGGERMNNVAPSGRINDLASHSLGLITNFLQVLRKRKQMKMLPKILNAFQKEWRLRRGVRKIEITYPKKFESSLHELEKKLSGLLGDKLEIEAAPSENLIGGFKFKIDDTLVDASIEANLKSLALRLIAN